MMIDLPAHGYRGRIYLGSFLRYRPLWLKYDGDEKLTDFQVKCTLTNQDIPLEKLRSDKRDLLFITYEGENIPYWIEKANASEIIVWLKFSEIIPGKEVFWLYYGNGNFPGASNGSAVFEFFDNFEDEEVGTTPSGWVIENLNPTVTVSDEAAFHGSKSVKFVDDSSGPGLAGPNFPKDYSDKIIIEFNWRVNGDDLDKINIESSGDGINKGLQLIHYPNGDLRARGTTEVTIGTVSDNTWYKITIKSRIFKNENDIYINDGEVGSALNVDFKDSRTSINCLRMQGDGSSKPIFYIDAIRLRKYAETEPSVEMRAEETA